MVSVLFALAAVIGLLMAMGPTPLPEAMVLENETPSVVVTQ